MPSAPSAGKLVQDWATQQQDSQSQSRDESLRALAYHGWIPAIPSAIATPPRMSLATLALWIDWVRTPLLLGQGAPVAPPLAVLHAVIQAMPMLDPADPWRHSAWIGELHQSLVQRPMLPAERRRRGIVFTPRTVANAMVASLDALVFPPLEGPLRILDPAVGAGIFWEALIADRLANAPSEQWVAIYVDLCRDHLIGIEIDPLLAALVACRARAGFWALKLDQYGGSRLEFDLEPPEAFPLLLTNADYLASAAGELVDVVIGNPPYGFGESLNPEEREHLVATYRVAHGRFDRAWCFFEASLRQLKSGGILSFLVPDALLGRPDASPLRQLLIEQAELIGIDHLGPVFPGIAVSSAVVTLRKRSRPIVVEAVEADRTFTASRTGDLSPASSLPLTLGDLVTIRRGEELGKSDCVPLGPDVIPVLRGEDIAPDVQPVARVGIHEPLRKSLHTYRSPKIVVVKTATAPIAAVDTNNFATLQSVYCLHLRPEVQLDLTTIAWLLNSPPVQRHVRARITGTKKLFPQMTQRELRAIPLPSLDTLRRLEQLRQETTPEKVLRDAIEEAWQESGGD